MSQNRKSTLPTAVERRNLLYGKESRKADHSALGRTYYEAGRLTDAAEFFALAEDEEGLDQIREHALEHGDAFLLAQLERFTGRTFEPDVWRDVARRADELGKERFARQARKKAGDVDESEAADAESDVGSGNDNAASA